MGTSPFRNAGKQRKLFVDVRARVTANVESRFLQFSSITASPAHLHLESAGQLVKAGCIVTLFIPPGWHLTTNAVAQNHYSIAKEIHKKLQRKCIYGFYHTALSSCPTAPMMGFEMFLQANKRSSSNFLSPTDFDFA